MLGWKRRRIALQEEMEAHIEIETRENMEAGMPADEARHAAMKKFGNPLLAVEHAREAWGWLRLERLLQDVRYALRGLRNAPGYTVTVVLTLALGLGAVATMLAVIDSVLLRPVALPHSDQLVLLYLAEEQDGTHASSQALSYKQIDELRRDTHSFSALAGYNVNARPVDGPDGSRVSILTEVTPDFFSMLGVHAKAGRLITPQDAHAPVVVVNDAFWRERLHRDPRAIGSEVRFDGKAHTVIGVLPEDVRFPNGVSGPIVYMPIALNAKGEDDFMFDSASTMARLKPGVFRQQALADAQAVLDHADPRGTEPRHVLKAVSYRDFVTGDVRRPLWSLLGGVAVLLLIACANAANLQIGRAASRMPEMQVRSALGASLGRLLKQLLTESLVVSLAGAVLGAGMAYAALAWVRHVYGGQFARFDELAVQPVVLVVLAALAVLAGVAASLAPGFSIRRETAARAGTRSTTRAARLSRVLVAFQVALTCVLLVTTGLFLRTFRSLEHVTLGFNPAGVSTLVIMPLDQHQDPQVSREIETRLLHRFETLPGVQSVTMQTALPFSSYNMTLNGTTDVEGRVYRKGDSAYYSMVSANFVRTSGIRLLEGRGFTAEDDSSANMVVLVNEAFTHKFLGGRDPVGVSLKFHREPKDTDADIPVLGPMRIVGVVENEMQGGDLGAPFEPMVYLDYLQLPRTSLLGMVFSMSAQYAVRSNLTPGTVASELRGALKQEAPSMAEMSLGRMEDGIAQSLAQRRLALRLVAGFGVVALVLSAIGIYGVLAWSVTLRRREIGVRLALGSSRAGVTRLVVRQAAAMVLFGLAPGLAGAWVAGREVRSFLFGVQALDPLSLASAGLVLLVVAAVAALVPALRAASVDPMETLRVE